MSKLPKITSLLFLCNILKTGVSEEIDFLHAGRHESLLQIDTLILMGRERSSIPRVPKIASLQCLYNLLKEVRDEVVFLHAYKHQSFLQVDTIITPGHDQASILKLLKVTSLQYLYIYIFINISLYLFRS